MTKDEALKLALELLESAHVATDLVWKRHDAVEAIKEALAQPEQEPVGWAEHGVINWLADKQFNHTSFLYDTPPQRTWVGLTDDEMKKTWYEMQNIMGWYSFQEIAQAIEAKLKEKNNGKAE